MNPPIVQISSLGVISVTGEDASKFLQGQLSCDVENLATHNYCFGLHCNAQGRIIAAFILYKDNERYLIVLPQDNIPNTLANLQRFAVFSKVELNNQSEENIILGAVPNTGVTATPQELSMYARLDLFKDLTLWIGKRQKGGASLEAHTESAAWHEQRLRHGIPLIYHATHAKHLAHRLNYHNSGFISFTKGCYVGQEIIARTHYKATIKHHLHLINIQAEHPVLPGAKCENGAAMLGDIIDAVSIEAGKTLALISCADTAQGFSECIIAGQPAFIQWEKTFQVVD